LYSLLLRGKFRPPNFLLLQPTSSKFFSCDCGYDGQFAHHKHYTKFFKKSVLQSSGIEGIGVDLVREQFFVEDSTLQQQ
jgi:hypothetical protein